MQVLRTVIPGRDFDFARAVRLAAKERGKSELAIVWEILRLAKGRQRLDPSEYFLYGAHQARLTAAERTEFLGERVLRAMNRALTPGPDGLAGLFTDKLLTDEVLTRNGLPVATVRAFAARDAARAPYPVLADRAAVAAFLSGTALPLFGKPAHGSRSVGAVSILDRAGSLLRLGDGTEVGIEAFADEIARSFPQGYLFQDLMQPHPDLARIVGPVISSLRVTTLRYGGKVRPLYSAMKMPGPGQMVDDIVSIINTMCGVDHRTGRIVRGQDSCRLGGIDLVENPVTGTTLAGAMLPMWPDVLQLVCDVHACFPRQGILGTDIAITRDGPRVIEVNGNALHAFYQKCFARGFWNAEIAPQMTEALASFGHRKARFGLGYP